VTRLYGPMFALVINQESQGTNMAKIARCDICKKSDEDLDFYMTDSDAESGYGEPIYCTEHTEGIDCYLGLKITLERDVCHKCRLKVLYALGKELIAIKD